MNTLFPVTVTALLLVSGCNKPEPPPEAAAPANETTDTVAAAGAPMADSAAAVADSVDSAKVDTTNN